MKRETSILKLSKKPYLVYDFTVGLYDLYLRIFIGNKEDFHRWVGKQYKENVSIGVDTFGRYFPCTDDKPSVIWIEDFNWFIDDQVTLTHELFHFVFDNLNDIGMTLATSSEEAYAYLLTNIQLKVWNKLKDELEKYSKLKTSKK
jgi:hypothetical protein